MDAPILTPVYRSAELRAIEATARPAPLMERAGKAAADVARATAGTRSGAVLVLAGPGNNGGDAFVVARWLRQWFFDVAVVFCADASALPADAAAAHRKFLDAGGTTVFDFPHGWRGSLIVDGLFGIGFKRALSAQYAAMVERANGSGVPILALDIPSGIDADTGAAVGSAIRAAATATFIVLKPGLLTGEGVDHAGNVSVHSLDIDSGTIAPARGHRVDWASLAAAMPDALTRSRRNVHKGTFGTLAIVGGGDGMVGAPILAARAAMKVGAGKVWIGFATPTPPAVDWTAPELMLRRADRVLGAGADAIVCGPGLGTDAAARELVSRAIAEGAPLVLDADALTLVAADAGLRSALATSKQSIVLTPHPAEAARLLACDTATIQRDRLAAAETLARQFNAHVVLKGAGSVLAHPDGSWDINASGNPGLATAGSGDVLAGFIGALLAQGLEAKAALRYAVCLHGAAADALVARGQGPLGIVASELADAARDILNAAR